jgi:RNA polymerase sigma-70 factor (ECF subfamily)
MPDESKVIRNALAGNQQAYTELLNTYWGDVNRFLLAKCNNEYEAEDLTIKSFSKAFDKLHLYKEDYPFKNWLLTIASNLFIDYYRAQQKTIESVSVDKEKVLHIPDSSTTAEDKLILEQQVVALLQLVKTLKPHYREVIQLRYFQEYSLKEIATEIDEPINNVKVKLLRAKKLLSEQIQNQKKVSKYKKI